MLLLCLSLYKIHGQVAMESLKLFAPKKYIEAVTLNAEVTNMPRVGSDENIITCLRGRCKHGRNESSFPRARVFIAFYLHSYIFNIYVVLCYSLVGQSS